MVPATLSSMEGDPPAATLSSSPLTPLLDDQKRQQQPVASSSTSSPPSTSASAVASTSTARPIVPSTPKKSILKRPPPPTKTFFSLGGLTRDIVLPGALSRLVPTNSSSVNNFVPASKVIDDTSDENSGKKDQKSLKRAHFILPRLTIVYPISTSTPPSSTELTESRNEIDVKTAAALKKEKEEGSGAWSLGRIEEFYRECCRLRDEIPLGGVVGALRVSQLVQSSSSDN